MTQCHIMCTNISDLLQADNLHVLQKIFPTTLQTLYVKEETLKET